MYRYSVAFFILLALMAATSLTRADDKINVYDGFRKFEPKTDGAIVDRRTTATIKQHMANLLYPVDMASFERPEKDEKFRLLIVALQKQMGALPTGILTSDEFDRLAEAAHDIDDRYIAVSPTMVWSDDQYGVAEAVGTASTPSAFIVPNYPSINTTRIFCVRAAGTCQLSYAAYDVKVPSLRLLQPETFNITTWEPTRITALSEGLCFTEMMTMDIKSESATVTSVPRAGLSICDKNMTAYTWTLIDGVSVSLKINQDRVNAARALVYKPAQGFLTPTQSESPSQN